jgi:hypothetical protein
VRILSNNLIEETKMMRMHVKQLAFAVALGTAMAAGAQSPNYPAAAPAANKPATAADRVPANRDDDATKACANVPAPEKEACMAKAQASKSGGTASKSSDSSTSSGATSSSSTSSTIAPSKSDSAPSKSDTAATKSDTTAPAK